MTFAVVGDFVISHNSTDNTGLAGWTNPTTHPGIVVGADRLRLPEQLPLDEWIGIGHRLTEIFDASAWWIGDWLVYGQSKYPDRYRYAIAQTRLDYQTLRNYAWIARKFDPDRRRRSLSFQHHVEVAALPAADQDHWLRLAEKFEWSRNDLRKQVKDSYDPGERKRVTSSVSLRIELSGERMSQWKRAAARSRRSLEEWILVNLDAIVECGPER